MIFCLFCFILALRKYLLVILKQKSKFHLNLVVKWQYYFEARRDGLTFSHFFFFCRPIWKTITSKNEVYWESGNGLAPALLPLSFVNLSKPSFFIDKRVLQDFFKFLPGQCFSASSGRLFKKCYHFYWSELQPGFKIFLKLLRQFSIESLY